MSLMNNIFTQRGKGGWLIIGLISLAVVSCGKGKAARGVGSGLDKIGFIDLEMVYEDYEKIERYEKELQETGKAKEEERDVIVKDLQKLKDEISLLSEAGRTERRSELDAKLEQLDKFDDEVRKELGGRQNQLLKEIFNDVEGVVNDYADQHGFELVFTNRSLIFRKDQYDLTKPIVRELNRRYQHAVGTA